MKIVKYVLHVSPEVINGTVKLTDYILSNTDKIQTINFVDMHVDFIVLGKLLGVVRLIEGTDINVHFIVRDDEAALEFSKHIDDLGPLVTPNSYSPSVIIEGLTDAAIVELYNTPNAHSKMSFSPLL